MLLKLQPASLNTFLEDAAGTNTSQEECSMNTSGESQVKVSDGMRSFPQMQINAGFWNIRTMDARRKAARVASQMRRYELVLAKVDGTGLEE